MVNCAAHERAPNLTICAKDENLSLHHRHMRLRTVAIFSSGGGDGSANGAPYALRCKADALGLVARVEDRLPPGAVIEIPAHRLGETRLEGLGARQPSSRSSFEASIA